jgi:2,4-dienoyl-CoA reductase-like NADH-dependent reductase (Old Yellow Enzyme family)
VPPEPIFVCFYIDILQRKRALCNRRHDGSIESRGRIVMEVIEKVQNMVGKNYLIEINIYSSDQLDVDRELGKQAIRLLSRMPSFTAT